MRFLVRIALRLLRIAGEAFFCFEVNRFLGRAVKGPIRHRLRALHTAEDQLLRHVCADTTTTDISLPCGLRIHTIVAGAAASVPPRPDPNPVVLLHGHSMAAAFFFRNIDHLLDMGFSSVYMPDLPGWGRSSRPRFAGDVEDAVDFFLRPFQHWLREMRLASFSLCGHSLGAYVAHEFAVRRPMSVRRLILASPAAITRHTPLSLALWFAFTPQRLLTHGGLIAHIMFTLRYPSQAVYNVDGFREFTLFTNSVAHMSGDAAAAKMLRFWRSGRTRWRSECVRPLLENIRRLNCPVEIISGDADELVHIEAVRAFYRALLAMGNDVRLNVISGADHTPHISAPAKFAKAIMRGMSNVGASGIQRVNQTIGGSLLVV